MDVALAERSVGADRYLGRVSPQYTIFSFLRDIVYRLYRHSYIDVYGRTRRRPFVGKLASPRQRHGFVQCCEDELVSAGRKWRYCATFSQHPFQDSRIPEPLRRHLSHENQNERLGEGLDYNGNYLKLIVR